MAIRYYRDPSGQVTPVEEDEARLLGWQEVEGPKQGQPGYVAGAAPYSGKGSDDTRPIRPKYSGIVDPLGNLREQYRLSAGPQFAQELDERMKAINLNTQVLEKLRSQALEEGESPWLKLALEQQGLEEKGQRDIAERLGAREAEDVYSRLAMRGGFSGGERERAATEGARGTILNLQEVAGTGAKSRLGLRSEDEARRQAIRLAMPGMELAALEPEARKVEAWGRARSGDIERGREAERWNIQKAVEDIRGKSAWDLGEYGEQMKAWAAEKTAQAQEKAGK